MASPFDNPSGTPTGPITRFAEHLGLGAPGRAHFEPIDRSETEEVGTNPETASQRETVESSGSLGVRIGGGG
jgi:hypothetical protein